MPEKDVLTPAEAAAYIGVGARTLQSWRSKGQGPRFVRIGFGQGRIRYLQAELDAWLGRRTVDTEDSE